MKVNKGSYLGKLVFTVFEYTGIISSIIMLFVARSGGTDSTSVAFVFVIISLVSLGLAIVIDDPNRLIRYIVATYSVVVAAVGGKFFPRNKHVIVMKKKLKRVGSYRSLYMFSLKSWDIIKYNEPTSRYFWGSDGPEYNRYHLKHEYDVIELKQKELIRKYNFDLRSNYRVIK